MLYIVATPIGNLKEIAFRAVEVLNSVDCIYAENPRHSLILLNHYEIKKPIFRYERFSEKQKSSEIISKLKDRQNIALITDAGMPIISDPGSVLLNRLIADKLEYTVVSGACAFVNALVLSGISAERFAFLGFCSDKKEISKFVKSDLTLVFYIPPHDFIALEKKLFEILGARRASLVREISKKFEEVVHFNLGSFPESQIKGELVLVVEGSLEKAEIPSDSTVVALIDELVEKGSTKRDAIRIASEKFGLAKNYIYAKANEKRNN